MASSSSISLNIHNNSTLKQQDSSVEGAKNVSTSAYLSTMSTLSRSQSQLGTSHISLNSHTMSGGLSNLSGLLAIHSSSRNISLNSVISRNNDSLNPDSKSGQKEYLCRLVDIINSTSGYNGFKNRHRDGTKITIDTFYDTKKLTTEFVQKIIIMLLVRFGFLSESQTNNGMLKEKIQPLPGTYFENAKVAPQPINVSVNNLHAKIMKIFFPDKNWTPKYYDASILICPQLNPNKVRTALSYFTHFCIFVTEFTRMVSPIDLVHDISIKAHVVKQNEDLRSRVEEEDRLNVQNKEEFRVLFEKKKDEVEMVSELDERIQSAENELQLYINEIEETKKVLSKFSKTLKPKEHQYLVTSTNVSSRHNEGSFCLTSSTKFRCENEKQQSTINAPSSHTTDEMPSENNENSRVKPTRNVCCDSYVVCVREFSEAEQKLKTGCKVSKEMDNIVIKTVQVKAKKDTTIDEEALKKSIVDCKTADNERAIMKREHALFLAGVDKKMGFKEMKLQSSKSNCIELKEKNNHFKNKLTSPLSDDNNNESDPELTSSVEGH